MMEDILVVEPFYGGSHAQLIQVLLSDPNIGPRIKLHTLPAKKWHWKARTSALYFMQTIESSQAYRVLFCSSVLNLTELMSLRPDLASLRKVVYFHENQLVYPVRKHQDRDFHYGYSQITTSLVADVILFNSEFNKESFLMSISSHLKLIPDHRPCNLQASIRPKCRVLYFPVQLDYKGNNVNQFEPNSHSVLTKEDDFQSDMSQVQVSTRPEVCFEECSIPICCPKKVGSDCTIERNCLHIVWPHRWEHDKDPETFFKVLFQLQEEGYDFQVSVLGESYQEVPEIFDVAKDRLGDRVVAWGFKNKQTYEKILDQAHVAVSTAIHEFFGVSMLEAAKRGCFPLCPKRLVYPEIYPEECLYSTYTQLLKRLKKFCNRPDKIPSPKINFEQYSWTSLQKDYYQLLCQHS